MATTDTDVNKKRLQNCEKVKPNLYKRMHSDQPDEECQGFVDIVEKFRYMKIKRTKMDIQKEVSSKMCSKNNMKKLMALRDNTKGSKMKSKFDALINVLEHLQLPDNYLTHCLDPETLNQETYDRQSAFKTCKGFIEFDAALDIFLDDVSQVKVDESRPDEQKTKFKDALLNEESGLRCFIFNGNNNKRLIFLDSDELDLLSYFEELIREENNFLDNEKFKSSQ